MRILHVITTINRGGAENHLIELIRGQRAQLHEVAVAYLKGDGYWTKSYDDLGVKVFPLGLTRYGEVRPLLALRSAFGQFKPEVVHAHMPPAELYARLALIGQSGTKFVISKHVDSVFFRGSNGQARSPVGALVARAVSARATHIVAISQAVKNFLVSDRVGIPEGKVKVIHYGLDLISYTTVPDGTVMNVRESLGVRKDELLVGTVARLVPQKSLHILIQAFARFEQEYTGATKLAIVGAGPLEDSLRDLAANLGIASKVVWAGFREDIPAVMSAFDIFTLTSEYEGFGLVLLEAMAAGTPVVASRISAIPEVVEEGRTGMLFPYGDVGALKEAFLALTNTALREEYGSACRQRVQDRFSPERMVRQTVDLYC